MTLGYEYDIYLFVCLRSGFVEMPAYLLLYFSLAYFKRTTNISAFMIFGGVSMLVIPMLQSSMPNFASTLGAIGKLGISSSFSVIYIHSNELFPTTIRNSGMGLVAVAARIGQRLLFYSEYTPWPNRFE